MEHIIASKLTQHFNKHNILYDLQHGFRERRSCETQLIQLVEDLGRKLIEHKQVDLVLLDFSKAFDKVSHSKLLFILSQHGVKGNTLNWIRAFLVLFSCYSHQSISDYSWEVYIVHSGVFAG